MIYRGSSISQKGLQSCGSRQEADRAWDKAIGTGGKQRGCAESSENQIISKGD